MEKFIHVDPLNCPFKDCPCEGCDDGVECDILVSDSILFDKEFNF